MQGAGRGLNLPAFRQTGKWPEFPVISFVRPRLDTGAVFPELLLE